MKAKLMRLMASLVAMVAVVCFVSACATGGGHGTGGPFKPKTVYVPVTVDTGQPWPLTAQSALHRVGTKTTIGAGTGQTLVLTLSGTSSVTVSLKGYRSKVAWNSTNLKLSMIGSPATSDFDATDDGGNPIFTGSDTITLQPGANSIKFRIKSAGITEPTQFSILGLDAGSTYGAVYDFVVTPATNMHGKKTSKH